MERSAATKSDIIHNLKKEILSLQGYKKASGNDTPNASLGPIAAAFPGNTFPLGAVHEFISMEAEDAAATNGFISGLLGQLMKQDGTALWVSTKRTVFPPALKTFGIKPQRIIFVDLYKYKECLWAVEEALKCDALTAVVGELGELSFAESRRLQLAVEKSNVTGFIHRYNPRSENAVACVTRWKIKPLPSQAPDGLPGLGRPRWNVELTKVRSGYPGSWQVEWGAGKFRPIIPKQVPAIPQVPKRKTG